MPQYLFSLNIGDKLQKLFFLIILKSHKDANKNPASVQLFSITDTNS